LETPEAAFWSLQKGQAAAGRSALDPSGMKVRDLESQLQDFADTAGVIAQLDLVISVDTAVAHLAGALGKPMWLLLPFAPDWRWQWDRSDSPWYPTMRLFRQRRPGDWPELLGRVSEELAATASRANGEQGVRADAATTGP
jgi:ADP-heptose:LPS heptosyltransferase